MIGNGPRIDWEADRVQGDINHWDIQFSNGGSISCYLDPQDNTHMTWAGNVNEQTKTGEMFVVEGDSGIAIRFEYDGGTELAFFETAASNFSAVGIVFAIPQSPTKERCVCWPPTAHGNCSPEDCDTGGVPCGGGGECHERHAGTIS